MNLDDGSQRIDAFGTPHKEPAEKRLWMAVVAQAATDALMARQTKAANDLERRDAVAFCTATYGEWARSRELACALAGVNPDKLRERILAGIAQGQKLTGMGKVAANSVAENSFVD
jgi:hypothetical protein